MSLSSGVAVVLLDERGFALLIRDSPTRWRLPGGAVKDGESPAETAVREAREEIGATVELDHLIAFYELRGKLSGLRFVYAARLSPGEVPAVVQGGEIFELDWFAPDALPEHTTTVAPWGVQDAIVGHAGLLRTINT